MRRESEHRAQRCSRASKRRSSNAWPSVGDRHPTAGGRSCVIMPTASSMDLFVVPTISFRLLYGLLILQHGRRAVYLLGGHGCCTLYEKSRLGALLCLDSSSFLTGYRFPMPRAKKPPGAWPLHCERHFKLI